MRKYFYYIILFFYIILPGTLLSQNLEDKLLTWMENNDREELLARLDKIKSSNTNSPTSLYVEAFLETDATHAKNLYEKVIQKFPNSLYAEYSGMKLAQYYFITESYVFARQLVDNIIDKFPQSKFIPEAKYLAALCLVATDNNKKAEKELRRIISNYPDSKFKEYAKDELERLVSYKKQENKPYNIKKPQPYINEKNQLTTQLKVYTIQIGAFANKNNAENLKEIFVQKGISTKIRTKNINDKLLHLVWIGDFETIDQAKTFGKMLKDRYNTSFRVVRK